MADILIVSEQPRGVLNPIVAEAAGAAAALAKAADGKVLVAVLAENPAAFTPRLSLAGVDEVIEVPVPAAGFQSDTFEAAALALIAPRRPAVVLLAHSIDSLGYAPSLAVRGGFGFATDVFGLRYEDGDLVAVRQAYQEKAHVELDFPGKETAVLTIRGGSFKAPEESASPAVTSFAAPAAESRTRHLAFRDPESGGGEDLAAAEYILPIGRGVADEDNVARFEEPADRGWLPKYRQFGQSGKTVSACKVCIAMGVSGSVQHLAGMKHVPNIIAVNKDPEAPIFTVARFGIVGDMFGIARELKAQPG